jgi:solute carrier family 25 (mitochondrial S-adenosylmethionine transporter), member 26
LFILLLNPFGHLIACFVDAGPSESIKQKVQAGFYPSTMVAMSNIWKQKGVVGFYEGYWGGVARDVPFRVAQLTTYELTKNLYLRIKQQRQERQRLTTRRSKKLRISIGENSFSALLTPAEAAFCGAIAGSFSAAITAPLDRIKTLLMTNSAAYGGTVASCAAKIWRDEGILGLTTGVVPRVVYIAPSVAIFFVAYEMTQQKLQNWKVTTVE